MKENHYDVAIVGGGISGTSLLFMLSKYSNIKSLALVEKYESLSPLNSRASANSQTIHSGDIETNYTFEKAKKVKKAADMTVKYCLNHGYENKIMFQTQKMAMGVGDEECEYIKKRFDEFKELYPYLEFYDKEVLKEIEPSVVFDKNGSERSENVVAMGVKTGVYTTADYGAMSVSLVNNAKKEGKICDIYLNSRVTKISKMGDEYYLQTTGGESISADFVVVNAGAHSLYLAHKMGYGKDLGTAIIAGSFYFTKQKMLNGKVYMVQNPKLPFAALHGDPDILKGGLTRFGPTALLLPLLERYRGLKSFPEAISAMNLDSQAIKFFLWTFKR